MVPKDDFAYINWLNLWVHQVHEKDGVEELKAKWIAQTRQPPREYGTLRMVACRIEKIEIRMNPSIISWYVQAS